MKARLGVLTVFLAAAATVAAAPAAFAQPVTPSCTSTPATDGVGGGGGQVCVTPGNAEISGTPPENPTPYWGGVLQSENYGPAIM